MTVLVQNVETAWYYFPDGDRLRVELRQGAGSGSIPSGIYRCDIETTAVHSTDNTRETVYVGLYNSGGEHAITF